MDMQDAVGFAPAGLSVGIIFGAVGWFVVRCVLGGFFTVDQSAR